MSGLSGYAEEKIREFLVDVDDEVVEAILNLLAYLVRLQVLTDGDAMCLAERLIRRYPPSAGAYLVIMDPWTPQVAATISGADLFLKIKSGTFTDGTDLERVVSIGLRIDGFRSAN